MAKSFAFAQLTREHISFATGLCRLFLGFDAPAFNPFAAAEAHGGVPVDHRQKTLHLDRCADCDAVLNSDRHPKYMYNPLSVLAKPTQFWCKACCGDADEK